MQNLQRLVIVATLLASVTAFAAEISVTLTDQEQAAMIQLLDTAVKSGGLNNAEAVLYFVKKIQAAQQQAAQAQQERR